MGSGEVRRLLVGPIVGGQSAIREADKRTIQPITERDERGPIEGVQGELEKVLFIRIVENMHSDGPTDETGRTDDI